MKIMLVVPPSGSGFNNLPRTTTPPLGVGYIASVLDQNIHKIEILDSNVLNYKNKMIKDEIKNFDPDIIGITAVTPSIYKAWAIAKIAKENNPNCFTVLGGPHPTVLDQESFKLSSHVDIVVRGEGEETFKEIVEKKAKNLENIKGITFKKNNKILRNKNRELIENLDDLPYPAYDLLPMDKYRTHARLVEPRKDRQSIGCITTSRGCPFNCIFCASHTLYGKKFRFRSPENILDELSILRYKYKKKEIDLSDDTFAINRKRTEKICQLIKKEDIDLSWSCSTRVNLFDRNLAKTLKDGGCFSVSFGVESGNQKILDFIDKGITLNQVERAVKIAKEYGFIVNVSFIIGIPGETKETIKQTITFAKKLRPTTAVFSLLTPYPGTKIFELAEKENMFITKDWSCYQMAEPVMKIPGFAPKDLNNLLKEAYYAFYFSPSYVADFLSNKNISLHARLSSFKNTILDPLRKNNKISQNFL